MFVVFDYILYNFLMRQFNLTSTYIIILILKRYPIIDETFNAMYRTS